MEKILNIAEFSGRKCGFKILTTKQTINLFIDNEGQCCEKWGYFWCNENPQEFIGAELHEVALTDTALNERQMEAKRVSSELRDPRRCYGGTMFVNLKTDRGILQFVAYNEQNGDYGHEATVECTQLMHTEVL